jgi:hypothetical protein
MIEPGGVVYVPKGQCLSDVLESVNSEKGASGFATDATHYQILKQQPIEIMQTLMTPEQFFGFCWGNVIKYALRCGNKDSRVKEMQKVAQYAEWAVEAEEGKTIDPRKERGERRA